MAAFDRSAYPRFPQKISGRELVARYTPSAEEIEWSHSAAHATRLQHASLVLLKCFQQLHYFPEPADIPAEIRSHIAGAIGIEDEGAFSLSAATRYRQQTAIRRYLGISPFYGNEGRRLAIRAASQAVLVVNHRVDLVNAIIDELIHRRYELPAYSTLAKIADEIASAGEARLIDLINDRLTDTQRAALDELIVVELDHRRSEYDRIKRSPKRPSRDNLDALTEQLTWLEGLGEVDKPLEGIAAIKLRYFANYAMALDAAELKDVKPRKRHALILALIQRLRARIRDDIAEMFVRRMATIHKRAKEELELIIVRQRERTEVLVAKFDGVLEMVAEDLSDADLGRRMKRFLAPGNDLEKLREECAQIRAWSDGNYLPLVWKHFRSHRAVVFRLVRALQLQSTSQVKALLGALDIVLAHEDHRGDTITDPVDLSFTSDRWRRLIKPARSKKVTLRRRDLEACVFSHLAANLRSGDLAIAGADSYADYRQQLLSWQDCKINLSAYCAKIDVPDTAEAFVEALKQELTQIAAQVDAALPNLGHDVTINDKGEPVLKRVLARDIPASAIALQGLLNRRLPTRNLLDVLTNIEHWTRFTRHFTPAAGTAPKLKYATERYLQTLFAMGCNLGPTQAARHFAADVTPHMLSFVHRKHMSIEQLETATRELTELYLQLDLPKVWGEGKAVAADGTQYDFYDNNLLAGYHFRYRKMGAVAYRHVADNYIAVFRHFIPPGIWEAVYVIEGLLKAGLSVEADTVYSDTQGQSATVFAFTYLQGIRLMPRIRNWKDLTFHRPGKKVRYQHIDQLFGDAVDWDLIETHWQELMQVALSIQAGKIASPTLLRKLSYGGPRNRLFAAAQELGQAVRTIFLLKWISNLELRQEVTSNTNKIESYNGFAKWFSFGGHVIPENDPDEQQKWLRYNDLVSACAILQNTVDMMRTLQDLAGEGKTVRGADLAFLSPYATSHVKRFGNYTLDLDKPPEPWLSEPLFREALREARQQVQSVARSHGTR